jgi:hypothetical protein
VPAWVGELFWNMMLYMVAVHKELAVCSGLAISTRNAVP